jgi:hypothetical protein
MESSLIDRTILDKPLGRSNISHIIRPGETPVTCGEAKNGGKDEA